jgi:hypothetical protein
MKERFLFLLVAVALLSPQAGAWFNDSGNDSCLTLYSDQQVYHAGFPMKQIEATIKVENKCKGNFTSDFSFLLGKKGDAEFKAIYFFNGKKWVDVSKEYSSGSITPGQTVGAGWRGVPVPAGDSLYKIVFLPQVYEGEFLVFIRNDKNSLEESILDPWFDSAITADSYTLGLWHFNENAGTNAASDVNTPTMDLTLSSASWDAANKKFGASAFKANSGPRATDTDPLSFTPTGNSLSVSFWMMPYATFDSSAVTPWYILSKYNVDSGPQSNFIISLEDTGGKMLVETKSGGVSCNLTSITASWTQNVWYHVLVTWNSVDGTRLYINGVRESVNAACTTLMESGTELNFRFGATAIGGVPANAAFDELEIAAVDRNAFNPGSTPADFYIELKKLGGISVDGTQKIYSYAVDGNVRIDFNILNSDNNRVKLDLNYSTQPYVGTGTKIVGDLNVVPSMCDDANVDWKNSARPCHWDFNISGAIDGNYYLVANAKNFNVSSYYDANKSDVSASLFGIDNIPDLNVMFFDENKNTLIRGMKASFNGVTYSVDLNLVIQLSGLAHGIYPLVVWQDNNYSARYFDINFYGQSTKLTALMLHDYNGLNFDFQFYDTDKATLLSNAFVKVLFDSNTTQMRLLNGNGETSFFLHPDRNYLFNIQRQDGSVVNYHSATITCAIPKDETTLLPVGTYTIAVSDLANRQYLNLTVPQVTWPVFGNTKKYYVLDINSVGYYTRRFETKIKGDTADYSLQPYLPPIAYSGEFVFYVKEKTSTSPISNVQIDVERTIPGEGTKQTQNITTDYAGTATISLLLGVDYTAYFYYGGALVFTATIRPTAASLYYQVALSISTIAPQITSTWLPIVAFTPGYGTILVQGSGVMDFNIDVNLNGKTFSTMTIYIKDTNGTVWDENHFTSPWTDGNRVVFRLDGNSWKTQFALQAIVDINVTDGNHIRKSVELTVIRFSEWDLGYRLGLLAQLLNPDGSKIGTTWIALIISILAVGCMAVLTGEPIFVGMTGIGLLFAFVAIGWIDLLPVLLATVGFIGAIFVLRRF